MDLQTTWLAASMDASGTQMSVGIVVVNVLLYHALVGYFRK